jgi:hypothetical protein
MRPNLLLMAKLTWLLLVIGGFGRTLLGPYTPAVGLFQAIPGESLLLSAGFWLGGFCLLLNRAVRGAAVITGSVVLLAPFESLPAWHPYAWVGGCVLVLAALQGSSENPRFLRWLLVVIHGAALLGAWQGAGWVQAALAEPWSPSDYLGSLPRRLDAHLAEGSLARGLRFASIGLCTVMTVGMMIPRLRRLAAWIALLFYAVVYLALGTSEVALFVGAVAIAQIAVIDWPRFIIVVWPRSCGWPLWLRVALDRYDFEGRTDWPRPPDPDAELEAWFDLKPFTGARAVANLVLVFPVFYFGLLGLLAAIHALLPSWVGVPANVFIVLGLLGFSVAANLGSLRARATQRPPPPGPGERPVAEAPELVIETADLDAPVVVAARGADQEPAHPHPPPAEAPEVIIDIDTPPPGDR